MSTSTETLPDLDSPYVLDAEQRASYARDGHIVLRGVVDPGELLPYRDLFLEAVQARSASVKPMAERDTYGKAFLQIMNLWRDDARLQRYVFAKRFAKIAADLMGVDGVRLYHDQALYKEPGGGFTPWHQDQHYWPLATDKTITLWMPLIDIQASMGTMNFASGSHTEGYLGDMEISDTSEATLAEFVRSKGYGVVNHGDMRGGDATFHSGWTLHGAGPNDSETLREVMTIIYYADGTKVAPADNKNRQADLDAWIPGGVPGELAASSLNPVLYAR
jgi:ectoine hydroxylase-related dioxygenase (phytanoyl-CoA dioxygenase family)